MVSFITKMNNHLTFFFLSNFTIMPTKPSPMDKISNGAESVSLSNHVISIIGSELVEKKSKIGIPVTKFFFGNRKSEFRWSKFFSEIGGIPAVYAYKSVRFILAFLEFGTFGDFARIYALIDILSIGGFFPVKLDFTHLRHHNELIGGVDHCRLVFHQ